MFTGIITGLGRVAVITRAGKGGARLTVTPPPRWGRLKAGESVSVSGVCLTAVVPGRSLVADLSAETLRRTTLADLSVGDHVNLERALRWGDRLSGHFVMGHVDGFARVRSVTRCGNSWTFRFAAAGALARFVVEKGSVALDGVSLTVAGRRARDFDVAVIPETFRRTTLGSARPGTRVNFEADVFARYGAWGWRRAVPRARRNR